MLSNKIAIQRKYYLQTQPYSENMLVIDKKIIKISLGFFTRCFLKIDVRFMNQQTYSFYKMGVNLSIK